MNDKKSSKWMWVLIAGILVFLCLICGLGIMFVLNIYQEETTQNESNTPPTPQATHASTLTSEIDGMQLLLIPASEFIMGSTDADLTYIDHELCRDCEAGWYSDEQPQHRVNLSAFWIDRTEVTNAMFEKFVSETGYVTEAEAEGLGQIYQSGEGIDTEGADWQHPRGAGSNITGMEDYPVVQVSWNDATAYCQWAGKRLPTEAEWEKAARGADGAIFPWGNADPSEELLNVSDPYADIENDDLSAVGNYPAGTSPYGAYDMAGNVWEWVNDWYDETYYQNSPVRNPQGPSDGSKRVARGGAWSNPSLVAVTTCRQLPPPERRRDDLGFRCVRSASSPEQDEPASELPSNGKVESPPEDTPRAGSENVMVSEIDGMEMVYVAEGDFLMGSTDSDIDYFIHELCVPSCLKEWYTNERPQHRVYLDAYYIDQTEVTNAMFQKFVADSGYRTEAEKDGWSYVMKGTDYSEMHGANWQHPHGPSSDIQGLDDHPVVQISWNDAAAYCQWAGRHLPTEAQWEKAARGTFGYIFPWGNQAPTDIRMNFADANTDFSFSDKNIDDGYKYTAPVGSYPAGASPYGALDMTGNAVEWVNDRYEEAFYSQSPASNPTGPQNGEMHILRGGSYMLYASASRTSIRGQNSPGVRTDDSGFRCAMNVDAP